MNGRDGPAGRVAAIGECMVELGRTAAGADTWRVGWGGDTLNTAVYLARLGVPVDYLTALGDDPFSDRMVDGWRAEGVGTRHVARLPGRMPGLYAIETDERGERTFHYWRGEAAARDVMATLDRAAALDATDLLYLSGITVSVVRPADRPALLGFLDEARARGVRVAFDTNFRPRAWPNRTEAQALFAEAIRRSDLVFTGLEDLALLGVADGAAAARAFLDRSGVREAVLRLSPVGCDVCRDGLFAPVALAAAGPAVDTTGAGDSFNAGYIAALRAGAAPDEAVDAAHRVARVVVMHRGAVVPREAADWRSLLGARGAAAAEGGRR